MYYSCSNQEIEDGEMDTMRRALAEEQAEQVAHIEDDLRAGVLPVIMEDAPIHTDAHPVCGDPTCPCHGALALEALPAPMGLSDLVSLDQEIGRNSHHLRRALMQYWAACESETAYAAARADLEREVDEMRAMLDGIGLLWL